MRLHSCLCKYILILVSKGVYSSIQILLCQCKNVTLICTSLHSHLLAYKKTHVCKSGCTYTNIYNLYSQNGITYLFDLFVTKLVQVV